MDKKQAVALLEQALNLKVIASKQEHIAYQQALEFLSKEEEKPKEEKKK